MTDLLGHQLGNYRLIRLLGHGGFADVYLGEHIHLNTLAAIKMLDARLTADEITQFRNEARTIARLEHPHIVRVLDFGVEDRFPFLVMSYAPNGTLRQRHPQRFTALSDRQAQRFPHRHLRRFDADHFRDPPCHRKRKGSRSGIDIQHPLRPPRRERLHRDLEQKLGLLRIRLEEGIGRDLEGEARQHLGSCAGAIF